MAQYNIFTGDPGFTNEYAAKMMAVSKEDVMRVYSQYIKGKNYLSTSFVPAGQLNLALEDSRKADVVEEKIVQGAEEQFDAAQVATYTRTPSGFDRSAEPTYGKAPQITTPSIWQDSLDNGIGVLGIQSNEVPMVQFRLRVEGGLYLDNPAKTGVANLLAELLTKGTRNKTPEQLEEAIQMLKLFLMKNSRLPVPASWWLAISRKKLCFSHCPC